MQAKRRKFLSETQDGFKDGFADGSQGNIHKFVAEKGLARILDPRSSVPTSGEDADLGYEDGYNQGYQEGFLQADDPNSKYQTGYKMGYSRGSADLDKGGRFNPNTNQAKDLEQTTKNGYTYGYQQGTC